MKDQYEDEEGRSWALIPEEIQFLILISIWHKTEGKLEFVLENQEMN